METFSKKLSRRFLNEMTWSLIQYFLISRLWYKFTPKNSEKCRDCRDSYLSKIKCGWNDSSRYFQFFSLALLKSASGGKVLEVFKIFKVLFHLKMTFWNVLITYFIWLNLHQYHKKTFLFVRTIDFAVTFL